MNTSTADYAIELAAGGIPVFPCYPDGHGARPNGRPYHKSPRIEGWQLQASTDIATITQWWQKWPDSLVGVPTGQRSGLYVLDLDVKPAAGISGVQSLQTAGMQPPATRINHTLTGGMHLLYRLPETGAAKTDAGVLGAGVDRRGDGGYIIWWPAHGGKVTHGALAGCPQWMVGTVRDGAPDDTLPPMGLTEHDMHDLLRRVQPEQMSSRSEWLRVGMALHHETGGSEHGLKMWDAYSMLWPKYEGRHVLEREWGTFGRTARVQVTMRSFVPQGWRQVDPTVAFAGGVVQAPNSYVPEVATDVSTALADPISVALMQQPTQDNIALIFARLFVGRFRYAHAQGKWLYWDGTRWRPENTGRAFHFAREVIRRANRDGNRGVASANFCAGVETYLKKDPTFAMRGDEFDADNYQLNTPAGTYDLRTGELYPHRQDDYITKITAVAPNVEGGSRFKRFLVEVTGGDEELIQFIKVALGACLSGAVEAHWLMFWTGGGRNGKNTLGDLVMHILGDYAKKIPVTTLMDKGHEAHPTELASLLGVRLATSSEINDGTHWHESRINELTGDARISARFMKKDFFEFPRTHKHLIYGNHRPQLRSITEALKSRLVIVPFKQSFVGREDYTLPAKLKDEAGFVLHWLIEGHTEWLRLNRKLPPCAAVLGETEDYFSAQSTVDMWVSECCEIVNSDELAASHLPKSSVLYNSYRQWKENRGEQPVSQTRWGEFMANRFTREMSAGTRYRGLRLTLAPGI